MAVRMAALLSAGPGSLLSLQWSPQAGGEGDGGATGDAEPAAPLGPPPCWPFPPDGLIPLAINGSGVASSRQPPGSFLIPASALPWSGVKSTPGASLAVVASSGIRVSRLCVPSPPSPPSSGSQTGIESRRSAIDGRHTRETVLSAFWSLGEAGCALPALLASIPARDDSGAAAAGPSGPLRPSDQGEDDTRSSGNRPCFFPGCQFSSRSRQTDGAFKRIEEAREWCSSCQVASFCCAQCWLSAKQGHEGVECALLKAIDMTAAQTKGNIE